MIELLNVQYTSVSSTQDQTKTIKYPKDFFGHPQANSLSDDITDPIKTISQNSSGGPDEYPAVLIKQGSQRKSLAHPLQLVY